MKDTKNNLGELSPARLRCEALIDPLAIVARRPRLSWIVESTGRNQSQSAYQILASSSPHVLALNRGDLWDSDKVNSEETLNIDYAGEPLASAQRCWWKVRVWDRAGRVSDWSAPAVFGAGLQSQDWRAEWIGFNKTRDLDLPEAPFVDAKWIWSSEYEESQATFVGTLNLPEDVIVEQSLVAITVAGKYRFWWRGECFGMSDGEPESWRRPYIRHMNERIRPGLNEFIIKAEKIGDEPAGVLFRAVVRAADGRIFTLVSDKSWRASSQADKPPEANATTDAEKASVESESIAKDWPVCRVVANYGDAPWGVIRGVENFLPPPAWLRGTFTLTQPVRRATLFATALGAYDVHLNGSRVNESYFNPGWTDYRKRLYYRAFDVTASLRSGENVLGAVLADGWFSGYIGWCHQRDVYGKHPRFRGQLHIEYVDGSSQVVGTDSNWKATIGPIKEADMLMGENHDARDEMRGWDYVAFDDSNWQPVNRGVSLDPELQPHPAPPVVALEAETFSPRTITEPKPGVLIFDLGQNFAGIVRLKVHQTVPGHKIVIRYGERLNADGSLYTLNLRSARATDTYICRGADEETWSPRFTFHGFQYVEISGLSSRPDAETITGVPLSTDTPLSGAFECSDALANRLASNVYWSQRSNFIEIPTDCPQRDERLGWCDAAWTFVNAGSLRADVQTFYNKWATDLDDAQSEDGLYPWLAPLVVTKPEISGTVLGGLQSGLVGRRRDLSLVDLPDLWRQTSTGRALPCNDPAGRMVSENESPRSTAA